MQKADKVFAAAPRPYRCLSETGDMCRSGEPEAMKKEGAALGSYA